jgi:amino-acid N-acetyltransferase
VADGRLVGAIGMERYEDTCLLRSAVVHPDFRGRGIGSALYEELLLHSQALMIRRLLLLTTAAKEYFRRKGFRPVQRKSVTGMVTSSEEFTGACPESAVCMQLFLWK